MRGFFMSRRLPTMRHLDSMEYSQIRMRMALFRSWERFEKLRWPDWHRVGASDSARSEQRRNKMGTEIRTWQIIDGKLVPIDTLLRIEGRTEPYDLEPWLASNPEIIGSDIAIIGRQVLTKSGPIDLLGIEGSGNSVVIEIKREELPRESLAQAIDYASDAAEWRAERLNKVRSAYTMKTLED